MTLSRRPRAAADRPVGPAGLPASFVVQYGDGLRVVDLSGCTVDAPAGAAAPGTDPAASTIAVGARADLGVAPTITLEQGLTAVHCWFLRR